MRKDQLLLLLFISGLFFYFVDQGGFLRYLYYALPLAGIMCYTQPKDQFANKLIVLFNNYKILFLINGAIVLFGGLYVKYFQESYLFLGSIFFAYTFYNLAPENVSKHITVILYASIAAFIFQEGGAVISVIKNPGAIVNAFLSSDISSESSTAFCFVILGFYFFVNKRFQHFFVAVIFLLLSFKRIAIAALLFGIVIYYLFNIISFERIKKSVAFVPVIINLIYINFVILLSNGVFDAYIKKHFGVSSNFLFQGRVVLYKKILRQVDEYSLTGNGIGKVAQILIDTRSANKISLLNLHADILKYFLELGVIGFIFFTFWLYKTLANNKASYSLCVIINVILLTDNISIYLPVIAMFFLIITKLNAA